MDDPKKSDYFTTSQIVAWLLLVATLIWIIFFLLSFPSISEYCEEGKLAYFGINIWEKEGCERYFFEIDKLEKEYNVGVYFLNFNNWTVYNSSNGINKSFCGSYVPPNSVYINLDRKRCNPINDTISHELKHHKCFVMGYRWQNNTDAHQ